MGILMYLFQIHHNTLHPNNPSKLKLGKKWLAKANCVNFNILHIADGDLIPTKSPNSVLEYKFRITKG